MNNGNGVSRGDRNREFRQPSLNLHALPEADQKNLDALARARRRRPQPD